MEGRGKARKPRSKSREGPVVEGRQTKRKRSPDDCPQEEDPSCSLTTSPSGQRRLTKKAKPDQEKPCQSSNITQTSIEDSSEFVPDEDQRKVISRWRDKRLIINAGPGSGKTSTLCALTAQIFRDNPEVRVVVLAYNRCAEEILFKRLKGLNVPLLDKRAAFDQSTSYGCLVLTFDKFGHHSTGGKQVYRGSNYRQALEKSVTVLETFDETHPARRWDWVIVDEAQDLIETHVHIVETLRKSSNHLVVAGDPRQELYPGATWFSKMWKDSSKNEQAELRYNHRSACEIVGFLNQYSSINFPDLHHHQIPVRSENGSVQVCRADSEVSYGALIAKNMTRSEPMNAFAISPVSIRKFLMNDVTNAVRQEIENRRPGSKVFLKDETYKERKSISSIKDYVIGTSRGLKGTERSRVVVYGVTAPFTDYGIKLEALKKQFYVAMSRAKDYLHIITNQSLPAESPFLELPQFSSINHSKDGECRRKVMPPAIDVTDLTKENYVWTDSQSAQGTDLPNTPTPVKIKIEDDPDMVGLYVELTVARCLGIDIKGTDICIKTISSSYCKDDGVFFSEDGKYVLNIPQNFPIKEVKALLKTSDQNKLSYAVSVVRRSIEIGRMWTKSKRLEEQSEKHREDCQPFADLVSQLLDDSESAEEIIYQKKHRVPIALHRSSKVAGHLCGISDFANSTCVVEIKYVKSLDRTHREQVAMYAAMNESPSAYLVNLRGKAEKVNPVPRAELLNLTRAKLALRAAQTMSASGKYDLNMTFPGFIGTCCIAVSLEKDPELGIIEIGTVAFGTDGQVLGTYHRVLEGVQELNLSDNKRNLCGLKVTDRMSLFKDQKKMLKTLNKWITTVSGRRCFIYWGCGINMADELKLTEQGSCHDLSENEHILRFGWQTLDTCVKGLFGSDCPYEPHRAFEDAVASASVFLALHE